MPRGFRGQIPTLQISGFETERTTSTRCISKSPLITEDVDTHVLDGGGDAVREPSSLAPGLSRALTKHFPSPASSTSLGSGHDPRSRISLVTHRCTFPWALCVLSQRRWFLLSECLVMVAFPHPRSDAMQVAPFPANTQTPSRTHRTWRAAYLLPADSALHAERLPLLTSP